MSIIKDYKSLIGIAVLILVYAFGSFNKRRLEDNRKQEDIEFDKLNASNACVSSVLISAQTSRGYTGTTLLYFKNGQKFSFSGMSRNYNISKADFDAFLQIGDSISKKNHSDTIYVYRGKSEYHFIVNTVIYKNEN